MQEPIPGGEEATLTLEDIPVGPVYRVWLSIVEEQEGWFTTYVWGESATFELRPGAKVAVQFSTSELYASQSSLIFQPVADQNANMTGKRLLDVEVYSGNIYTTDGSKLYQISNFPPGAAPLTINEFDAPSGQSINSVSVALGPGGSTYPCVDTDQGIYSFNGEGFDSPPTSVNLGSASVLDSGSGGYTSGSVLFFRRASGWGGTYAQDGTNPPDWIWINQDSGRVTDLAVSGAGQAYYATADGAFRFSGEYLYKRSQGETPNIGDYKAGFSAPSHILSLGIIRPETEDLLMGTENGAWRAGLAGGPEVIGPPQRVDGTQGYRIRRIATHYEDLYNFAAYLSDLYLFVWGDTLGQLYKCPLAAGLPGRVTGMAWYYPGGSTYYLIVSGSEGLAYIGFDVPM